MKENDFKGLIRGLKEARNFARGNEIQGFKVHLPRSVDNGEVSRPLEQRKAIQDL